MLLLPPLSGAPVFSLPDSGSLDSIATTGTGSDC